MTTTNETNTTDQITTTEKAADNHAMVTSTKDQILYFICGLLGDALPGFFFSATVITSMNIPNGSVTPLSLSADLGGVIGVLIASFALTKIKPEMRVTFNVILQVIGILLAWLLDYPSNVIGGVGILTIGFVGMLSTIMPLTSYAGEGATRAYQVGFAGAPIFGVLIVELGNVFHFGTNGLFAIALCIPILNFFSFFALDRSSFHKRDNGDEIDYEDSGVDGIKAIQTESTTKTVDNSVVDEEDLTVSSKVMTVAERDIDERQELPNLSLNDYLDASKEIALRYWPIYVVSFALKQFWSVSLSQPYFFSSSATFEGQDGTNATVTTDNILLATHVGVFLIGLSIFTVIGKLLPRQSSFLLWIPNVGQMILVAIVIAGVVFGLGNGPLPISVNYVFNIFEYGFFYFVYLYTPLFVRNDEKLTKRFTEFHQQSLLIVSNITFLAVDIISIVWTTKAVMNACESNYETNFEGVSCTYNTTQV